MIILIKLCTIFTVTGSTPWIDNVIKNAKQTDIPKNIEHSFLVISNGSDKQTMQNIINATTLSERILVQDKMGKGGAAPPFMDGGNCQGLYPMSS